MRQGYPLAQTFKVQSDDETNEEQSLEEILEAIKNAGIVLHVTIYIFTPQYNYFDTSIRINCRVFTMYCILKVAWKPSRTILDVKKKKERQSKGKKKKEGLKYLS